MKPRLTCCARRSLPALPPARFSVFGMKPSLRADWVSFKPELPRPPRPFRRTAEKQLQLAMVEFALGTRRGRVTTSAALLPCARLALRVLVLAPDSGPHPHPPPRPARSGLHVHRARPVPAVRPAQPPAALASSAASRQPAHLRRGPALTARVPAVQEGGLETSLRRVQQGKSFYASARHPCEIRPAR